MRIPTKVLVAVGVVGLAAASSAAFTGSGLTNSAGGTQFVGGTVNQTVSGATLSNVLYEFTDPAKTAVNKVTLTFADATGGKIPTISLSGGTAVTFTCVAVDATTFKSVCSPAAGASQTGVTGIAVTVA